MDEAAGEPHKRIGEVLPPPDDGVIEEWPVWPYLRIELPRSEVERLEQASESERVLLSHQILRDYGLVVESDARAAQMFGRAGFPHGMKFEALLKTWQSTYPDSDATVVRLLLRADHDGREAGLPCHSVDSYQGGRRRRGVHPRAESHQASSLRWKRAVRPLLLQPVDPRAVPVTSRMIPAGDFFYKNLAKLMRNRSS